MYISNTLFKNLLTLYDSTLVDSEGGEWDAESLDSYLFWIPLPDDFKFFNDNAPNHIREKIPNYNFLKSQITSTK